ncbi:MAG: tetratricopeptide repeat protein, partial [Phycisphaerae bacterium]|nr:tetratricopeptide repeat protein [Phycisphaerae bacterium]
KGEYDKAIADYNKAIELEPKVAGFYLNVAEALITLKRNFRRAVERLEQGRGRDAFENDRDRLIACCLEGIALALNGDDASAAEAEAKRLQAGGAKAGDWDTEPMERFLKDLKPKDFAPDALKTARRIQEMLKK